ncbi:Aqualysin 1 [Actinobacteria bacterium OK074]|nr:Aqualysin 1 [Actinobacteria bacterium OK074]
MARTRRARRRRAGALTAVCATAALSFTAPAAQAAPEGRVLGAGTPGTVSGSYIVTLKDGTRAVSTAGKNLAAQYGARISHAYGRVLNGYAIEASSAQARRLAADSRVASVAQDTEVADSHFQQNPPSWGLDRIDQRALPLDRGYTWPESAGAGVTVYVVDTGIRITHKDFGGRASYGWDFVDGDARAQDGNGHGTHVAGTIAGTTYGVAKEAKLVAVRVLDDDGSGTTADVIAGIDWVTAHAHKPAVANLSLDGYANPQLDAAVRNSIASGVTYTVAAGNDGAPAGDYSPARVRQAITVGATDRKDARAAYSNYGPALDLFAPGTAITSDWNTSDTAKATVSGTSMAAPHATGAAALYLADHPTATPARVGTALEQQAAAGAVTDAGQGSPKRLLQVDNP